MLIIVDDLLCLICATLTRKVCMMNLCLALLVQQPVPTPVQLLQVLNIQQAAQLLVHCDPEKPAVEEEELLNYVAEQEGCLSKQEPLGCAESPKGLAHCDWAHFWQYSEAVSLFVSKRTDYIPVGKLQPNAVPASKHLYMY